MYTARKLADTLSGCCSSGDLDAVRLLLKKNKFEADAVNDALRRGVENGHVEVVKCLMEETQADVNTLTADRKSLLMLVRRGDVKMAEMLCQHGCDVNHVDCHGNTALIQVLTDCVVDRDEPVIDLFLEHGASVNVVSDSPNYYSPKNSPLILAIDLNCRIVRKLLAAGADVNLGTSSWKTPIRQACKIRDNDVRTEMCKLIVESGPLKAEELHLQMWWNQTEMVEFMIDNGVVPGLSDVVMKNEELSWLPKLKSPLFVGLWMMRLDMIQLILDRNFLNETDLYIPREIYVGLHKKDRSNYHYVQMFESIYNSPWSLWTLCFVKISTCVGLESDRRDRISQTGLPQSLQNKLMFRSSPKN